MTSQRDEWVVVRVFTAYTPSQLARGLLESEGVECYIHGEQNSSLLGRLSAVEPRLMVRRDDLPRAEEILAASDLARDDPDAVHLLCDYDGERPELRDLENLQLDLVGLTLCSVGLGAARATLEATLGELVPAPGGGRELHKPDLGAILHLDAEDRLAGFELQVAEPAEPSAMESFPGFWDPGGSLKPPGAEDLAAFFGGPTEDRAVTGGRQVIWRLETATVSVTYDRQGGMQRFRVEHRG